MRYNLTHTTTYSYSEPVSICHNEVHLVPRDTPRQKCLSHRLSIRPHPAVTHRLVDYFGNHATLFSIQLEHRKLVVMATSRLEVRQGVVPTLDTSSPWEHIRDESPRDVSPEGLDVLQYAYDSPHVRTSPELADYARDSFAPGRPLLEATADLTRRIHSEFHYDTAATTVSTPLEEVQRIRRGVCQDFAHLQIGCLRSLGLPARYVSGYICTSPVSGGPRVVGADASHAWVSVHCPGLGWVDFDPTNNSMPTEGHVTVAWGRDYSDVCPVKGVVLGGGQHALAVSVDLEPEAEAPAFSS